MSARSGSAPDSAILFWLLSAGVAIIASGTAIFFGLCAATFLPAYLGGLYFRWLTRAGAVAGMLTGFLASGFWIFFCHKDESEPLKLCKALFDTDCLLTGVTTGPILWDKVDPMFVGLPLSLAVTVVVSLLTRNTRDRGHAERCFTNITA